MGSRRGDPPGRGVPDAIEERRPGERDVVAEIDITDGFDPVALIRLRALGADGAPDPVAQVGRVVDLLQLELGEGELGGRQAELAHLVSRQTTGERESVVEGHSAASADGPAPTSPIALFSASTAVAGSFFRCSLAAASSATSWS